MKQNMQKQHEQSHTPILNINQNPQLLHFSGYVYAYILSIVFLNILTDIKFHK
jgi:hypothetical protein